MKLTTPLERVIAALEERAAREAFGHRREGLDYALALCRSFEDFDPEHDLDLYLQGWNDARRIYTQLNTTENETNNSH